MTQRRKNRASRGKRAPARQILKAPTGIPGLDEITGGGLPKGRPTLICGDAGCGKTVLAMEFLVRGAVQFGERGLFVTFEESEVDLTTNFASMGFDLKTLTARKKLAIDHVRVERSRVDETGEYDLEGLFIRLGHAIKGIGAKRVVLDTVEALFGGFTNTAILRIELCRLFEWLKKKKVTAIITGERGANRNFLTRHGLEEYVSDCVILLDHRVSAQLTTRRLRIVKYRGSRHGLDEYPFLIGEQGVSVLPITSLSLQHPASTDRMSSGIPALDQMLGVKGFFRGSTILVSGMTGTGKSIMAAHFTDAACRRGERCLYLASEESPSQILRNIRSVGIDLASHQREGLLQVQAARPTLHGLELHLVTMHKAVREFRPQVVVIDSITSFITMGGSAEVTSMFTRMIDFLKAHQITLFITSLQDADLSGESSNVNISSLVDAWILLRNLEKDGVRTRALFVLKTRGMDHSNRIREFALTGTGIELLKEIKESVHDVDGAK